MVKASPAATAPAEEDLMGLTRNWSRTLVLLGVLGIAAALSGCTVHATTRPAYATGYVSSGTVVYTAPPAPRATVTVRPSAPYHGAIWVDGHWQWNGAQYVWVDGFYQQPRAGYVYVQPRWERRGNGYVYVQGNWNPHRGNVHVQTTNRPHHRTHHQRRGNVTVRARTPAPPSGNVRVRVH